MSNRKAYVRVTVRRRLTNNPIEIIAGVELATPSTPEQGSVTSQYNRLRQIVSDAVPPSMEEWSDAAINAAVELAILNHYPRGVSYFVEVGRGSLDEYVQVYQP